MTFSLIVICVQHQAYPIIHSVDKSLLHSCLRQEELSAMQEPGPDPVPEGGQPGEQGIPETAGQDVAVVVAGEHQLAV